ncbi:unnamed protein product [Rotaria sp. Silwood1]|nr:unnamed protein product [Rotaria sp. Silwood1]CAF4898232.1 unnamed protein product [Rotaria sp. Silwood1]CAF5155060.1 unnamed protein product [Rotaria sp. Silwood1]
MSLNGTTNNNEIVQYKEFQLHRDHFQSIRKQLTDSEIQTVGNELKIAFNKLEDTSSIIQQIPTLLYI